MQYYVSKHMRKHGLQVPLVAFLVMWFVAGEAAYSSAGATGPCHTTGDVHSLHYPCSTEQLEALQSGGCCCRGPSAPCDCEVKESRTGDQGPPPVSVLHSTGTNPVGMWVANPHVAVTPYPTDNPPGLFWIQARAPSEIISLHTTKLLC